MTGKEFFGRLLNNRQEEDHSYDEEPSRDQSPGGEVDVAARGAERHDSHDASAPFGGSNYPSPDAAYDEFTAPAQASPAAEAYDRLGGDGIDADFPEFRPAAGEQSYNLNGRAAHLEALENGSSNGTFGDSHPFDAPSSPASNGSHAGTPPVEGTPYDPAETSARPAESRWSSPELTERMAHELEEAAEQLHAPGANGTSSAAPSPQQYEMPGLSVEPAQQGPAPLEYDFPAESYPISPEQQSPVVQGVPETAPPIAPNPTQHAAPEPVNHGPQPAPAPQVHPEPVVEVNVPPVDVQVPPAVHETPSSDPSASMGPAEAATAPPEPAGGPEPEPTPEQIKASRAAEKEQQARAAKVTDAEVANVRDRVVQRLLEKNIVSVDQVKRAIADRSRQGLKATLWRILAQQATVDREVVYREAALTYAFVERKIDQDTIDVDFIRRVAEVFPEKKRNRLIELHIVPIGYEFEQQTQLLRVVFITHDPSLPAVRELMQDLNLERYELQYASESTVKDLLARAFPKKNEYLERMSDDPLAYDLGTSYEDEKSELIDEDALEAEINRSSLINLFEGALVEAVHRGASDIHIYPNARRQIEIHFRVDGRLSLWHTEEKIHPESLLAVIKDNTMNVDRFERDMAQDGFIQRKVDDTLIRYRVSILPIATASNNIHAESIVIRVLDDRKVITDLSKLGLLEGALERFDMAIRQPHGMVILTGPTGSGKSTTLVAALHQVVTPEVNVLTVEDPVEYIIPGVRQIKLNHKLGLEGALRAILRHDPDVVMVGEMRDRATAELAVKLANTGHLTFSTLHTNDAPSAVSRLYKMGVEPFLIAYAINLVVAQRLLRNLCPSCKVVDDDPDLVLMKRLGFTDEDLKTHTIYKAGNNPGCRTCKGNGYKGRRAISEALYFSREIRHMIVEADTKIDEDGLRELARSQGMLTLQDSAREVVKMGESSVEEMMRVTMSEG